MSDASTLLVVDRHQHEVDVGLRPDGVVRQAAAEDGREDRAVRLHLLDQRVERGGELLLDVRLVNHERCAAEHSYGPRSGEVRGSG